LLSRPGCCQVRQVTWQQLAAAGRLGLKAQSVATAQKAEQTWVRDVIRAGGLLQARPAADQHQQQQQQPHPEPTPCQKTLLLEVVCHAGSSSNHQLQEVLLQNLQVLPSSQMRAAAQHATTLMSVARKRPAQAASTHSAASSRDTARAAAAAAAAAAAEAGGDDEQADIDDDADTQELPWGLTGQQLAVSPSGLPASLRSQAAAYAPTDTGAAAASNRVGGDVAVGEGRQPAGATTHAVGSSVMPPIRRRPSLSTAEQPHGDALASAGFSAIRVSSLAAELTACLRGRPSRLSPSAAAAAAAEGAVPAAQAGRRLSMRPAEQPASQQHTGLLQHDPGPQQKREKQPLPALWKEEQDQDQEQQDGQQLLWQRGRGQQVGRGGRGRGV